MILHASRRSFTALVSPMKCSLHLHPDLTSVVYDLIHLEEVRAHQWDVRRLIMTSHRYLIYLYFYCTYWSLLPTQIEGSYSKFEAFVFVSVCRISSQTDGLISKLNIKKNKMTVTKVTLRETFFFVRRTLILLTLARFIV